MPNLFQAPGQQPMNLFQSIFLNHQGLLGDLARAPILRQQQMANAQQAAMLNPTMPSQSGAITTDNSGGSIVPGGMGAGPPPNAPLLNYTPAQDQNPDPAMQGLTPFQRSAAQSLIMQGKPEEAWAMIKQPDPQIAFDPQGRPYNQHSTDALSAGPAANIQNVNGFEVNQNDTSNVGRFLPKIADGATPLYDGKGNVVAQKLLDGTVQAVQEQARATAAGTEQGKSPYDLVSVPTRDGGSRMMPRSAALAALGGGDQGGSGNPFSDQQSQGPSDGLGVSQNPGDAAYQGERAKTAASHFAEIQTAAESANTQRSTMQQINGLLGNFEGGKFAPMGLELASALNSLGIPMSKGMSNAQAADALGKQMALQLRNPASGAGMPGSMSNQDRNFLASMVPGLLQSAKGRQQMIGYFDTLAQRSQQRADLARQWQDSVGRIDSPDKHGKHFDDYWTAYINSHPLFKHN